jgi:hypothetical protein
MYLYTHLLVFAYTCIHIDVRYAYTYLFIQLDVWQMRIEELRQHKYQSVVPNISAWYAPYLPLTWHTHNSPPFQRQHVNCTCTTHRRSQNTRVRTHTTHPHTHTERIIFITHCLEQWTIIDDILPSPIPGLGKDTQKPTHTHLPLTRPLLSESHCPRYFRPYQHMCMYVCMHVWYFRP